MGTSSNHRSRAIPPWRPARAILARHDVSTEAQSRELWRAALGDERALLRERLAGEVVQMARGLSQAAKTPIEAISQFDTFLLGSKNASLFDSIARRALVRAVTKGGGSEQFGAELFAETATYLAARDLPSYVGAVDRIQTVAEAVAIKGELQARARQAASSALQKGAKSSSWPEYVSQVLAALVSRENS